MPGRIASILLSARFAFLALVFLLPLLAILFSAAMTDDFSIIRHVIETQGRETVINTVSIVALVSFSAGILGSLLGYLLARYRFWGSGAMEKLLVVPLAIPAYVSAFVYLGIFEYSGPLQWFLREKFSINLFDMGFQFQSVPGLIFVLTMATFPYVYLISRRAFENQGAQLEEASASLGKRPIQVFSSVTLPLALPSIVAGICLVALETLGDFGAVSVFNLSVFTTQIYRIWFSFFSLESAALVSVILLVLIGILLFMKRLADQKASALSEQISVQKIDLSGFLSVLAFAFCFVVFCLSFLIPVIQLIAWSLKVGVDHLLENSDSVFNSIVGAIGFAFLIGVIAFSFEYRIKSSHPSRVDTFVGFGYGLPGTLLATGVFIGLFNLGEVFSAGTWVTQTLIALFIGYLIRFLAVSRYSIRSASLSLSSSLEEASESLGVSGLKMFRRLHWPMLRQSFAVGVLFASIEIVKEMPLTLMLRPFGWETLSTRIYEYTSEGMWQEASSYSLLICLVAILPIMVYFKTPAWSRS